MDISPARQKVLAALLTGPKKYSETMRSSALADKVVWQTLQYLESKGFVAPQGEGRSRIYAITEQGVKALAVAQQDGAIADLFDKSALRKELVATLLGRLCGLVLVLFDEGRNWNSFSVEDDGSSSARYVYLPPTGTNRLSGWLELSGQISVGGKVGGQWVERAGPILPFNGTKWGKKYGECWEYIDELRSFINRLKATKIVDSVLIDRGVEEAEQSFNREGLRSKLVPDKPQKERGNQSWAIRFVKSSNYRDYSQALTFGVPRLGLTLGELKHVIEGTMSLENLVRYFEIRISNLSEALKKLQQA